MVVVKSVSAKHLLDSRGEKTILVSINTNAGKFSASAPNGKSTGKHEASPYKKDLEKDIETLKKFKDYFSDDVVDDFNDLRRIEDTVEGHIGANSLFALESAILKALAKEKKKEVWQIINQNARKFPRLVGNCIGGGKHSGPDTKKKPDFQEFLLIPKTDSVKEAFEINKKAKKEIAGFLKRKKYHYQNPVLERTVEEQFSYMGNLIKNFGLFYVEDPFDEDDFASFAKLLKKYPNAMVVGDDLTATNIKRLQKAIDNKSINAIIVKPNQNGSLIKVKSLCELARKNNIKIVFSHRSGETEENILADLAFGFGADFFKCGITGKEREAKIRRLIEIENKLRK